MARAKTDTRRPDDIVVHVDCRDAVHDMTGDCICVLRRQREHDAKGGTAIPAQDRTHEARFHTMPGPNRQATPNERAFLDRDDLACKTEDVSLFFPLPGSAQNVHAQENAAKAVCRRCPAVTECLRYAFDTQDDHAILGATTPKERREMRRREGIGARPVESAA